MYAGLHIESGQTVRASTVRRTDRWWHHLKQKMLPFEVDGCNTHPVQTSTNRQHSEQDNPSLMYIHVHVHVHGAIIVLHVPWEMVERREHRALPTEHRHSTCRHAHYQIDVGHILTVRRQTKTMTLHKTFTDLHTAMDPQACMLN